MARFSIVCRDCRRVVLTTARIGSAELVRLREHMRQAHAREALPADAAAGAILPHFDVSPAP